MSEIGTFYKLRPGLWRSTRSDGYLPAPNDLLPHPDQERSGPVDGGRLLAIIPGDPHPVYRLGNLLTAKPEGGYDLYEDQDLELDVPASWYGGSYRFVEIDRSELPLAHTLGKHAKNQALRNVFEQRTNQTANSLPANLIRAYAGMNRPPSHIQAAIRRRRNGLANSGGSRRGSRTRRRQRTARSTRKTRS
jgi:hypothetical protein